MSKSRFLTIQFIPDGTGQVWALRLRYALLKFLLYTIILGFIALSFLIYRVADTVADHLQGIKSELLDKQYQISRLERELGRLGEQEQVIRNIISAYVNKDDLENDNENIDVMTPSGLIAKDFLRAYVTKVKAIEGKRKKLPVRLSDFPNIWPVSGVISQKFSAFQHGLGHSGIDIIASDNSLITATGSGIVVESGWDRDLGKMVEIEHGNDIHTLYGHLNRRLVQVGDHVEKGTSIGTLGNTGNSSGPHLHYEIMVKGKPVDPLLLLK